MSTLSVDSGKYSIEDKDLPLRENIRLLGRMLGDTLREQEGDSTFELIESIRQTAIRFHREQDPKARDKLDIVLNQLSSRGTVAVARAFSYFRNFLISQKMCIIITVDGPIFVPDQCCRTEAWH